jgi:hypothetical protein
MALWVGLTVGHIWSSYATCLFLQFGHLTPHGTYTDLRGNDREFQPKGVWSITSMKVGRHGGFAEVAG